MVAQTPVVIGQGVVGVQLYGLVEVLYGLRIQSGQVEVLEGLVVVFYAIVGVLYGQLVLELLLVAKTPVVVGQGVVGVKLYGLVVVHYGPLVLAQVPVGITAVTVASGGLSLEVGQTVLKSVRQRFRAIW